MNSIRELVENFKTSGKYRGKILFDEPTAPHTTFKIGGRAPLWFEPADADALIGTLLFLRENGLPHFILGGGSNVVVSDKGFDGAVISTAGLRFVRRTAPPSAAESRAVQSAAAESRAAQKNNAAPQSECAAHSAGDSATQENAAPQKNAAAESRAEQSSAEPQSERAAHGADNAAPQSECAAESRAAQKNNAAPQSGRSADNAVYLECGAGANVAAVVSYCTEHALSGMQAFAGLPGSVGGAVYMNARCFGVSFSDIFVSAEYIELPSLEIRRRPFSAEEWDYKKSPFQDTQRIILSAVLRAEQKAEAEKDAIAAECRAFISERVSKGHFRYPSAGSVFRNDRAAGKPSGRIIDEAGLRGLRIGGAQVAPWHGNFIVNTGGATQADVQNLVRRVTETVREKYGVALRPEIIFCGKN